MSEYFCGILRFIQALEHMGGQGIDLKGAAIWYADYINEVCNSITCIWVNGKNIYMIKLEICLKYELKIFNLLYLGINFLFQVVIFWEN